MLAGIVISAPGRGFGQVGDGLTGGGSVGTAIRHAGGGGVGAARGARRHQHRSWEMANLGLSPHIYKIKENKLYLF